MAIQYSGGPYTSSLGPHASVADLVATLQAQAVAAGWVVVAGSGAGEFRMRSPLTAQGVSTSVFVGFDSTDISFRPEFPSVIPAGVGIREPKQFNFFAGSGKPGFVYMNWSGGGGGADWRVVVTPTTFCIYRPAAATGTGLTWYFQSCLYLPDGMIAGSLGRASVSCGNITMPFFTAGTSWRTQLALGSVLGSWSIMYGGSSIGGGKGSSDLPGGLQFVVPLSGSVNQANDVYRFADNSVMGPIEPLVAASPFDNLGPYGNENNKLFRLTLYGQLFDCCLLLDGIPADALHTIDGHTFLSLTDNNFGSASNRRGTLLVRIA